MYALLTLYTVLILYQAWRPPTLPWLIEFLTLYTKRQGCPPSSNELSTASRVATMIILSRLSRRCQAGEANWLICVASKISSSHRFTMWVSFDAHEARTLSMPAMNHSLMPCSVGGSLPRTIGRRIMELHGCGYLGIA